MTLHVTETSKQHSTEVINIDLPANDDIYSRCKFETRPPCRKALTDAVCTVDFEQTHKFDAGSMRVTGYLKVEKSAAHDFQAVGSYPWITMVKGAYESVPASTSNNEETQTAGS